MKAVIKHLLSAAVSVITAAACFSPAPSFAAQKLVGYRGDVNLDKTVNAADLVALSYMVNGRLVTGEQFIPFSDINSDGSIDSLDLLLLRKMLVGTVAPIEIYEETPEAPFISPPIVNLDGNLPSQGSGQAVIFYVDFPDCRYTFEPDVDFIEKVAFGEENYADPNFPFESMTEFYRRSSKGVMELGGKVFRYTAKENISSYGDNKEKLAEECYSAFDDAVDFSIFDGNSDGKIDVTIISVPSQANKDDWWPCAGPFGDYGFKADNLRLGHMITGNAQIESYSDYYDFNSSYLHEMGHCMGLPDYYLYYTEDDWDGMHGDAGWELMDGDATTDFGAFSKLMLGWYRENQIQVYDGSQSQTFTLKKAQSNEGNCIIIPKGKLDDNYFSEYFIIEYSTGDGNNSNPAWWQKTEEGVRIFHVKADVKLDYWWPIFVYENGSEYTGGDDDGIRLIRLVNDSYGDNYFYSGDVIDSSVSGFGWYDSYENESVDPMISVSVEKTSDEEYSVTISQK